MADKIFFCFRFIDKTVNLKSKHDTRKRTMFNLVEVHFLSFVQDLWSFKCNKHTIKLKTAILHKINISE